MIKNLPAVQELQEMRLRSLSQGDPLDRERGPGGGSGANSRHWGGGGGRQTTSGGRGEVGRVHCDSTGEKGARGFFSLGKEAFL